MKERCEGWLETSIDGKESLESCDTSLGEEGPSNHMQL